MDIFVNLGQFEDLLPLNSMYIESFCKFSASKISLEYKDQ